MGGNHITAIGHIVFGLWIKRGESLERLGISQRQVGRCLVGQCDLTGTTKDIPHVITGVGNHVTGGVGNDRLDACGQCHIRQCGLQREGFINAQGRRGLVRQCDACNLGRCHQWRDGLDPRQDIVGCILDGDAVEFGGFGDGGNVTGQHIRDSQFVITLHKFERIAIGGELCRCQRQGFARHITQADAGNGLAFDQSRQLVDISSHSGCCIGDGQ